MIGGCCPTFSNTTVESPCRSRVDFIGTIDPHHSPKSEPNDSLVTEENWGAVLRMCNPDMLQWKITVPTTSAAPHFQRTYKTDMLCERKDEFVIYYAWLTFL